MTEITATTDPANANPPSAPVVPASNPAGEMVEKKRLDNALQKIEQLTIANRTLSDENTTLKSQVGTLTAGLTQKESDMAAKVGELTTQLTESNKSRDTLSVQASSSAAFQEKIKTITDMKRPDLLGLLDLVPDGTPEEMKAKIEKIAAYSNEVAQAREKQLTAGVLPTETSATKTTVVLPTTEDGWSKYMENFPLGSPDRQAAFDAWHSWLMKPKS